MVCYSHLLKKSPQFIVIHTIKGFSVVNETEVDVFLELSCFFYDPTEVGSLISGYSAFLKSMHQAWICCIVGVAKAEEPEIKLLTSAGSSKKQDSCRKTSISALLTMPKPLTV